MAHLRRCPGLAQETELSRFVTQISFANDLEGYGASQIHIEGLVGDAHCPHDPTRLVCHPHPASPHSSRNGRTRDPASAPSALAAANPVTESASSVVVDS